MDMKCPICGSLLVLDESYDGWLNGNTYAEDVYGHCPACGRQYQWTNNYVYKDTTDFKEVRE